MLPSATVLAGRLIGRLALLGILWGGAALASYAQQQVGIGTTTPDPKAALDISASDKGLLIPRLDSAQRVALGTPPDGLMVFQKNGRVGLWYAFGGTWFYIPDKVKSGDNLGNHTATEPIKFATNDADKLLLTAAGGANASKLAHSGGWSVDYHAGTTAGFGVSGQHRFLTASATGGWNERLRITSSGQVGIGTTSPRGHFDVDGAGDIYLADDPFSGTTQSLYVPGHLYLSPYNGSNVAYLQARRADNSGSLGLQLRTTNAGTIRDALYLAPDGRTGINTNAPKEDLDVAGTAQVRETAFARAIVSTDFQSRLGPGPNADNQMHSIQCSDGWAMTNVNLYASAAFDGYLATNCANLSGIIDATGGGWINGPGFGADNQTHIVSCPAGQVATGWRAYATQYLDGDLGLLCRPLQAGYVLGNKFLLTNQFGTIASSGDNIFHGGSCPSGTFITEVQIYSQTYFEYFPNIYCAGIRPQ